MTRLGLLAAAAVLAALPCLARAQSFSFATIDNPADPTFNQLLGINDSGVIVGYFGIDTAGHPNKGYQTESPYTSFTSVNQPGSAQTQITGINNAGIETGFWSDTNKGSGDANFGLVREPAPSGPKFQFLSVNDPNVSSSPRVTQVLGINNNDLSVGFYNDAAGNAHAFSYDVGTATYTEIVIAKVMGLGATGINDGGLVCGFLVNSAGGVGGFVRNANGGVVTRFRVPGSASTQLLGINNAGVAVGFYIDHGGLPHGVYYTPSNGNWLPVNDPNGTLGTVVNGINNKNQLVGFYTDSANNTHGMLVTVSP